MKQKTRTEPLKLDFEAALSDDDFKDIMKELVEISAPDPRKQAEAAEFVGKFFS